MMVVVLAFSMLTMSAGAQGAVRVFVDGDQVLFDQPPITQGGRVLVPLRGIFEKIGAFVEWNAATRSVRAARGTTLVELQIGSRIARVDGRAVTLDVPPMVVGGRTLVPLRFISESLGAAVDYRAESRTVLISTTGQAGPPPGPPAGPPPPAPPTGQTLRGVITAVTPAQRSSDQPSISVESGNIAYRIAITLDTAIT
ncbi:MAG TPA: copper amine oxidase N-terminal domain-containing protein, partial [bacterium]